MDWRSEEYRDHEIGALAHESGSSPGKWLGSYEIKKDGEVVARAAVVNLYDSAAEARQNILRIAKQVLDDLLDR